MAGRPPLPIGTHGKVSTTEIRPRVFEAITRYCDLDGVVRRVKARGNSRTAAENSLKTALSERRFNAGVQLSGSSKVVDAADLWFATLQARLEAGDRAPGTVTNYESVWRVHIKLRLGSVRLREVTTARCESWMVEMRRNSGASHCAKARAVLSSILGYAVRMGAIPLNPVRDISPIPGAGGRKRKPRSLSADARRDLLSWLDNNVAHNPRQSRQPKLWHATADVIASRALGDVVRFQLATGCRIGEVMGVSWDEVDLEAGTVEIAWHVVQARGQGIVRVPGTKTKTGQRVLKLPSWAVDMLLARRVNSGGALPVFPNELGGWRDPGQVLRWLRWSCREAGIEWAGSHVFRQTVITELDKAGLSTREVGDQAGHAKLAQTQAYMARNTASDRAADALENMVG